jgi:hypothetical protein
MRPQAHVASGLVVWSLADAPWWEAPVDVVAANLPDFDRSVAKRLGVEGRKHHTWPSHSAVFWALPTLVALKTGKGRRQMGLVWIHLVLDTYADGIAWLWPRDKEKRGLFRKPEFIHDDGWTTPAPLSTELGKIELAMWAATAASAVRRLAGSGAGRARSSRSRRRRRPRLAVP